VDGRQELVAVAEMVFAELPGRVAKRLERFGDGDVLRLKPERCARQADLGKTSAQRCLPGDEGRAAGGAALLGIVVGEHHALAGEAVDARGLVSHHAERIGADVRLPDVVAKND
jgi:hypothetical protein